jgi:hypothetical protein
LETHVLARRSPPAARFSSIALIFMRLPPGFLLAGAALARLDAEDA